MATGTPSATLPAPPPPLPANEHIALQLAQLTAEYTTRICLLLKLSGTTTTEFSERAFSQVASSSTFQTVGAMFSNNTPFADVLRGLNRLSLTATETLHKHANVGTNEHNATMTRESGGLTENISADFPPYLRAVRQPTRVHRLPRLPILTTAADPAHNATTTQNQRDIELTRRGMNRCMRTANRVLGYEGHKIIRIQSESPMRGARHMREALNEGGFTGPSVVVPSSDPRILYILAQPRHLAST